jgi:ribonuclease R
VLRFVRENPGTVGKREIARAFGIRGNDRIALKSLLKELEAEGAVEGRRKRVRPPGTLPPVTVLEVHDIDIDGELQARPERWSGPDAPPRITLDPAPRRVPAPGVGDRVLARLRRNEDGSYDARPIRLLDAGRHQVLGLFRSDGEGGGFIQPTDRRARRDYAVRADETADARSGELVVAEAVSDRRLGLPRAKVLERIGDMDAPGAISLLAIHSHGLPTRFSDEALAEAEAATEPTVDGRTDLRSLPLVTIDGPDARDFDDAVWAEPDPSAKNKGGWRIVVAIADVAYFVQPGSALDGAAHERGNSAYFPDRVVPMLPEALSAGLCSLKPGVDRACLAVHLRIDADGALLDFRFERALMRSAARLTYGQVQKAADGAADADLEAAVAALVPPLYGAYRVLRAARAARGALELDLPEHTVTIAEDGSVARIGLAPRYDSNRVIEEFMIAANVAAAAALEAKQAGCMYRVHDQPDLAKLEALRGFLETFGLKLTRSRQVRAANFNHILAKVADTQNAEIINLMVLRSQAQAAYSPHNIGHFGLGLVRYAHFTSPIRRYADLLVHRALIGAYRLGPGGVTDASQADLAVIGTHISTTERRAQAAERDANDRYTAAFLADRVGAEFQARISGVTRFGIFVALDETGADGLVPGRTLGASRPRFDERRHTLEVDGRPLRLGDRVLVSLREADPVAGGLVFELLEVDGMPWSKPRGRPPSPRRGPRRRR